MADFILNGKKIGEIDGDTYTSRRNVKIHYYRKLKGYPIDVAVLEELKKRGVKKIVIVEYEENVRAFTTSLDKYLNAKAIKHPPFKEQRCLPISNMKSRSIPLKEMLKQENVYQGQNHGK